ncbi:MAG: YggS family pyridoxal phosphate-dependent enzyme [Weeksellaceae bacterium]|jgi:pyridoxal phosphate enzyme (YggS family)|nr:YggS family pyridoxal phosphate-dependent enzyme [Weeksellaceae bacterium]
MSLIANLKEIRNSLPEEVTLVAVSKTKPVDDILALHQAGQLDFGENRVQELVKKQEILPDKIRWHLIGHLQKNKVKYIAGFVYMIHSVDSTALLKEINKQAEKHNRRINCLLQIRIADEDTKFGMEKEEAQEILNHCKTEYPFTNICGLMGMATFTDNQEQLRKEFRTLKLYFDYFKTYYSGMKILSMGMSGDYPIAVEEGSNLVRIGSLIFGTRT